MMRYLLYDDDGILLRKFWSMEAAEKFLQSGYRIEVLKKERVKRVSAASIDYIELFGDPPF